MTTEKEKTVFYLRVILCISLIAFWSFWLTNSSKENKPPKIHLSSDKIKVKTTTQKTQVKKEKKKDEGLKDQLASNPKTIIKETKIVLVEKNKKETLKKDKEKLAKNPSIKQSIYNKEITAELPKLVTLPPATITPKKKEEKLESVSKKEEKKEKEENLKTEDSKPKTKDNKSEDMINLELPNLASATRKALSSTKPEQKSLSESISLRKEITVDKSKLKPVSVQIQESKEKENLQKMYLSESWLPKYNNEGENQEFKSKSPTEDLDLIAEQIELSGIVNNPNGESTAIIKNKANNFIEVLKKGDSYKGLKLLEVNKNEVILGNKALNKFYTKKINLER